MTTYLPHTGPHEAVHGDGIPRGRPRHPAGPLGTFPPGPAGEVRLLADWYATGRSADLDRHLHAHGPAPLSVAAGRRGAGPLIAMVESAGLTGRGGAAFPTGRKLRAVEGGRGPAVVVANGMESEPAAAKDRTLLTVAPHLVLDGAVLAAHAVGANAVHVCLARNRGRLVEALRTQVAERVRRGLDGVPIQVHAVPHHYVSSEESSLVHWINGGEAKPLSVPPRPFEKGVAGRPTLVDNVETLAHLALIARHGPAWFREVGRPDAPGSSLFTVSGAVNDPGVVECGLGVRLDRLVAGCGGISEPVQAFLLGGFFGSWVPAAEAAALRMSAPQLKAAGTAIGAGVVVALPAEACGIAETARILRHLADESAGQCGPCMFGLPAVADDMAALAGGRRERGLLQRLRQRLGLLPGRGACRHPDGAARLAASALQAFADDAQRHASGYVCAAARRRVVAVPRADRSAAWR